MSALARVGRLRTIEREGADRTARACARERAQAEQALARLEALIASGSPPCVDRESSAAELAARAGVRDRLETARLTLALGAARAKRHAHDAHTVSNMARARQDAVAAALAERARAAQARADARALEAAPALARGLLGQGMAARPIKP